MKARITVRIALVDSDGDVTEEHGRNKYVDFGDNPRFVAHELDGPARDVLDFVLSHFGDPDDKPGTPLLPPTPDVQADDLDQLTAAVKSRIHLVDWGRMRVALLRASKLACPEPSDVEQEPTWTDDYAAAFTDGQRVGWTDGWAAFHHQLLVTLAHALGVRIATNGEQVTR
jgi:hypothetical protein